MAAQNGIQGSNWSQKSPDSINIRQNHNAFKLQNWKYSDFFSTSRKLIAEIYHQELDSISLFKMWWKVKIFTNQSWNISESKNRTEVNGSGSRMSSFILVCSNAIFLDGIPWRTLNDRKSSQLHWQTKGEKATEGAQKGLRFWKYTFIFCCTFNTGTLQYLSQFSF